MSLVRHCDKCKKMLTGIDAKHVHQLRTNHEIQNSINVEPVRDIDLCSSCFGKFVNWLNTDDTAVKTVILNKQAADIQKGLEASKKLEDKGGLNASILDIIEEHSEELFPSNVASSGQYNAKIDYGQVSKTRFNNKLKDLGIKTVKDYIEAFDSIKTFNTFFSATSSVTARYYIILRILKTEGYFDSLNNTQKNELKKNNGVKA